MIYKLVINCILEKTGCSRRLVHDVFLKLFDQVYNSVTIAQQPCNGKCNSETQRLVQNVSLNLEAL